MTVIQASWKTAEAMPDIQWVMGGMIAYAFPKGHKNMKVFWDLFSEEVYIQPPGGTNRNIATDIGSSGKFKKVVEDFFQNEIFIDASMQKGAPNPYSPDSNPYQVNTPSPGTPDDLLDGPPQPMPTPDVPMTTRPRQMPNGDDGTPEANEQTSMELSSMKLPLYCLETGKRFQAALTADLTCVCGKDDFEVDLRAEGMETDPPWGMMENHQPEMDELPGNDEYTKPFEEGGPEGLEDWEKMHQEARKAQYRKMSGGLLSPDSVRHREKKARTVDGWDKSMQPVNTYEDLVEMLPVWTKLDGALMLNVAEGPAVLDQVNGRFVWTVTDTGGVDVASGATQSLEESQQAAEAEVGALMGNQPKLPLAANKIARIAQDIRADNPEVGIERAEKLARLTIKKYPMLKRVAQNFDPSKDELLKAQEFLRGLHVGDVVIVNIDGRASEMVVSQALRARDFAYEPDGSLGPAGSWESAGVMVTYGIGGYSSHISVTQQAGKISPYIMSNTGRKGDPNRRRDEEGNWPAFASKTADIAPESVGISVGSIFYESWGYDQTNIDFYQVVEMTGASVRIRKIKSKTVSSNPPQDMVAAVPGSYIGEPVLKRVQEHNGEPYLSMSSYSSAYLWDGEPKYQTSLGWGH